MSTFLTGPSTIRSCLVLPGVAYLHGQGRGRRWGDLYTIWIDILKIQWSSSRFRTRQVCFGIRIKRRGMRFFSCSTAHSLGNFGDYYSILCTRCRIRYNKTASHKYYEAIPTTPPFRRHHSRLANHARADIAVGDRSSFLTCPSTSPSCLVLPGDRLPTWLGRGSHTYLVREGEEGRGEVI